MNKIQIEQQNRFHVYKMCVFFIFSFWKQTRQRCTGPLGLCLSPKVENVRTTEKSGLHFRDRFVFLRADFAVHGKCLLEI